MIIAKLLSICIWFWSLKKELSERGIIVALFTEECGVLLAEISSFGNLSL